MIYIILIAIISILAGILIYFIKDSYVLTEKLVEIDALRKKHYNSYLKVNTALKACREKNRIQKKSKENLINKKRVGK